MTSSVDLDAGEKNGTNRLDCTSASVIRAEIWISARDKRGHKIRKEKRKSQRPNFMCPPQGGGGTVDSYNPTLLSARRTVKMAMTGDEDEAGASVERFDRKVFFDSQIVS